MATVSRTIVRGGLTSTRTILVLLIVLMISLPGVQCRRHPRGYPRRLAAI